MPGPARSCLRLTAKFSNSIPNLYTRIKERIIENFAVSSEAELRNMLKGETISEGRPTAILSKLRHLSRGRCNNEILKALFLEQLPPGCKAILSVSDNDDLSRLANMADKIVEHGPSLNGSIAVVTVKNSIDNNETKILNLLDTLVTRVDARSTRGREKNRNFNNKRNKSQPRSRSKSNNGRNPKSTANNSDFYFYHNKFGINARKCRPPCRLYKETNSGN